MLWGVPGWGSVPGQGYSCPVQGPSLQMPWTECPSSQACSVDQGTHLSLLGTELHSLGCLARASLMIRRLVLTLLPWGCPWKTLFTVSCPHPLALGTSAQEHSGQGLLIWASLGLAPRLLSAWHMPRQKEKAGPSLPSTLP